MFKSVKLDNSQASIVSLNLFSSISLRSLMRISVYPEYPDRYLVSHIFGPNSLNLIMHSKPSISLFKCH
jgi:hypothetical protein